MDYILSNTDSRFFKYALGACYTSNSLRARVGCALASGSRLITTASNMLRSHPIQCDYNFRREFPVERHNIHAEISALMKIRHREYKNLKIYVIRIRKDGTIGMARPCKACMEALRDYGVKTVFYTTNKEGQHMRERLD